MFCHAFSLLSSKALAKRTCSTGGRVRPPGSGLMRTFVLTATCCLEDTAAHSASLQPEVSTSMIRRQGRATSTCNLKDASGSPGIELLYYMGGSGRPAQSVNMMCRLVMCWYHGYNTLRV
ncbi:hypothetical protein DFH94DRAFT_6978 [Russula ochroleuca]|uniref:Uncharacterized protein n=1 Tax=Russula ochroleuca TaxID=152965 RepID=A0A9P5TDN7_9AGAM|nr:hypothetical protein DFH94DRAFT_6978 [Russula ochroleuca]